MKFTLAALGAAYTSLLSGAAATPLAARSNDSVCISPRPLPDLTGADIRRVGVVLFQALDMIDVFGPLDPLQIMAKSTQQMRLHILVTVLFGVDAVIHPTSAHTKMVTAGADVLASFLIDAQQVPVV